MKITIATRGSLLALWQARQVKQLLEAHAPGSEVSLLEVSTEGDRRTDVALSSIGGRGVFAKEVQLAVLSGEADIAVHSAKDLPALTPEALVIAAVLERGDPRDALVGSTLAGLGPGATVATGSVRRRAQLASLRPDLNFIELRGNIDTRLSRVPDGGAILMAVAALQRLDRHPEVLDVLSVVDMIPQVGQGTLAVEARKNDSATRALLEAINDSESAQCLAAERAFLVELGGDCDLPAGAFAWKEGESLALSAMLSDLADSSNHGSSGESGRIVRTVMRGDDPSDLGASCARDLRAQLGMGGDRRL